MNSAKYLYNLVDYKFPGLVIRDAQTVGRGGRVVCGLVAFRHEITITEKLAVMDKIGEMFGGEFESQRKGSVVFFWRDGENVKFEKDADGKYWMKF